MWADDYVGIPFIYDGRDRSGCDCYGLLRIVYRDELGIDLPELKIGLTDTTERIRETASHLKAEREHWLPVEKPHPYDAVILKTGRFLWHVGVVIDRRFMLHTDIGMNSAIEEYKGMQWGKRIDGFCRYAC